MINPDVKFAASRGLDLPLFYIYVAGYMSGEKLKECNRLNSLKYRKNHPGCDKRTYKQCINKKNEI